MEHKRLVELVRMFFKARIGEGVVAGHVGKAKAMSEVHEDVVLFTVEVLNSFRNALNIPHQFKLSSESSKRKFVDNRFMFVVRDSYKIFIGEKMLEKKVETARIMSQLMDEVLLVIVKLLVFFRHRKLSVNAAIILLDNNSNEMFDGYLQFSEDTTCKIERL
ncbi:unnamed protein product [Bursaphelenchus xylophilus]|uniref:(pine wood nematode) hypothetical protein n=1 Tax=Bursaphelenchus xylophilus TaxID=6326 RepID=A0A1I7SB02_BURXY|nr:unnamed protein product [Bursaphelenchus xylophilus]CAG9105978.1 unnamed protein product [Bursaphelenchus xylophilus]